MEKTIPFFTQNIAICAEKIIVTLVFYVFAKKWSKSTNIVIITLTPHPSPLD
jgi:hypothetical protein